jgi:hypothetical protein
MYIIAAILQLIPGRDLRAERLSFQTRLTAFVFAARIELVTVHGVNSAQNAGAQ